jgi:hypothetical protein
MSAKMLNSKRPVKLRGIVIPIEWDSEGNVLAVALSSFDEINYMVETNPNDMEFLNYLQKEVEVTGIIGVKDGQKTILAHSFLST